MFGRNEFAVAPLHQEAVNAVPGCDFKYPLPYTLPDSIMSAIGMTSGDSLYAVYFDAAYEQQFRRVSVELGEAPVKIIGPSAIRWKDADLPMVKACILLMDNKHSAVLIDHRKRIRGYYDASDRDEVDRLIVEINVILKRY
jgi:hypothetical protein